MTHPESFARLHGVNSGELREDLSRDCAAFLGLSDEFKPQTVFVEKEESAVKFGFKKKVGSQPEARARWPPRRPSEIISMRLPTSLERITWRIKPGNACWWLGSHQAVDQSLLALFGQMLPLLSIFLTALQKWGAVLRHAGQCLKRGQRLQCSRKKT